MPETIESIIKKFQPCGSQILCEPILSAEKSKGGLFIPEQARNPLNQGRIVSISDQLNAEDWPLGSIVMWSAHSQSTLRIDDVELVIVGVENILLKSTKENA